MRHPVAAGAVVLAVFFPLGVLTGYLDGESWSENLVRTARGCAVLAAVVTAIFFLVRRPRWRQLFGRLLGQREPKRRRHIWPVVVIDLVLALIVIAEIDLALGG